MTEGDWHDADEFAAYLVTEGLADNSIRNYRCLYQRWVDWCVTTENRPTRTRSQSVRGRRRSTRHGRCSNRPRR